MSLKNWSVTAASNSSAPPDGAPEGSTLLGDVSNILRQIMADVRTLAAADTIAAAGTTDIGTKDATFLTLTGTATTITALGTVSAGIYKYIIYNAAHSLTYNATSLILVGNASRTVAAGDVSLFISEGSGNWRELMYMPDAGYVTAATVAAGYQPQDALLTALAAQTTAANNVQAYSGVDTPTLLSTGTSSGNIPLVGTKSATETLAGLVELATQAEAEAGTDNTVVMTALRTAQAIVVLASTVKVSANDTTPGYLNGKLVAGTGITLTEGSDGANETLTIASTGVLKDAGVSGIGVMSLMSYVSGPAIPSGGTVAGASLKYPNGVTSPAGTWRNISTDAITDSIQGLFQRIA